MFLKKINSLSKRGDYIWIRFLPFLVLYLIIAIVNLPVELDGDEPRYVRYAENLLNGFLSPTDPKEIDLWSGPGYSMLMAFFLLLKTPLVIIRILNAFLIYGAIILTFRSIRLYASQKQSLVFSSILGLYFPIFTMLPRLLTECLTWFLISLIVFLFLKYFKHNSKSPKYIIVTSFAIGFLAMTKVIFGYVIVCMLLISILLSIIPKSRFIGLKSSKIFFFSLIFCLPYLLYTYHLTGKTFYWSNSGGMSLYTMSSPFEDELGDWLNKDYLTTSPNHKIFADSIFQLEPLDRDSAFKAKAIENIQKYPKKYLKNWTANVNRFLFSFPFSHTNQTMKLNIFANMFVVVFIILSGVYCCINYKRVPSEIKIVLLFVLIYCFGSSLVSTYLRMFYITMPFWIVFMAFSYNRAVKINIKSSD